MVPDFKTVLRFDDLYAKPSNLNLERYVRHKTPLMYLRRELIKLPFTDLQVEGAQSKLIDQKTKTLGNLKRKDTKKTEQEEEAAV